MSSMDFSGLSDDQLVELIREAWVEANKRGRATTSASKQAVMDENEKFRVAQTATEREIEKLKKQEEQRIADEAAREIRRQAEEQHKAKEQKKIEELWKEKDQIANKFQAILRLGYGSTLRVWSNTDATDVRIYINSEKTKTRRGFGHEELVYYHTGNNKHKPRTIVVDRLHKDDEAQLRQACYEVCQRGWTRLVVDIPEHVEQKEEAKNEQ